MVHSIEEGVPQGIAGGEKGFVRKIKEALCEGNKAVLSAESNANTLKYQILLSAPLFSDYRKCFDMLFIFNLSVFF